MKALKTITTKFFAATCIIALAAGCASVTDAGLSGPTEQTKIEVQVPTPDPVPFGDLEQKPIMDKPLD